MRIPSVWAARALLLAGSLSMVGCATLPASGPTSSAIEGDHRSAELLGFHLAEITSADAVAAANGQPQTGLGLSSLAAVAPVDTVGPGDVLAVTIYEVGAGLFSGGGTGATPLGSDSPLGTAAGAGAAGSSAIGLIVDRDGAITIPYVGRMVVAGLTPGQIQERIQRGLRGMSQSPQALVSVRRNVSNTVVVLGVVARPGRQELTLAGDRLLDAIAQAGGTGERRRRIW